MLDSIIKEGLIYTPKFLGKTSNKNYGDLVSHEDYNELVNLNTTQGDYNSEVLRTLFTETDDTKTYHIPYLDTLLVTELEKVFADKDEINERIDENVETLESYAETMADIVEENNTIHNLITDLTTGVTSIPLADYATNIRGVEEAGPEMYYGTNTDSDTGFFQLPPAVLAEDASSSDVGVSAIYIAPRANSVAETMLTDELRTKINRVDGVTDYNYLSNLPSINGITLRNNVSLAQLNITSSSQHALDIQAAKDYTDSKHAAALNEVQELNDIVDRDYLQKTSAAGTYALIESLNITNGRVSTAEDEIDALQRTTNTLNNTVNNRTQTFFTTSGISPKNGDLYIQL